MEFKRGQIWYADLMPTVGSEQGGCRPVIIVSNDIGNKYSPVVTIVPITSKVKKPLPTHCIIKTGEGGLNRDGVILCEQIRTISKDRLSDYKGDFPFMAKINKALNIVLGLL